MQCPKFPKVSELLDRTNSPEEQRWLESHLASCSQCQQQLDSLLEPIPTPRVDSTYVMEAPAEPIVPVDDRFEGPGSPTLGPSDKPGVKGTLGPYEVIDELGAGAFGIVYLARDPLIHRDFAIKVLRLDRSRKPRYLERFVSEARLANQVTSPYVVPVLRVGLQPEFPYPCLVMERVDGQTLRDAIQQQTDVQRRTGYRKTASMIARTAEGLHAVHETGLVHRDIKPANILIDATTGVPRLTDFGLARDTTTGGESAERAGTLAYMGPEVIGSGASDRRSDVYSLGIVLYEALVGERPFRADTPTALRRQIIEDGPVPLRSWNEAIPRDLETITLKCLHKDPERRYQTARELADDLDRFLAGHAIHARPVSRAERAWLWCRRNPWPTAAGILLLTATLMVSGLAFRLMVALQRESWLRQDAETQRRHVAESYQRQLNSMEFFANALNEHMPVTPTTIEVRSQLEEVYLEHFRGQLAEQTDRSTVYFADACAVYAYHAGAFGRIQEAREHYEQALASYAAVESDDWPVQRRKIEYQINLAKIYHALGEPDLAYQQLDHAQRLCERFVRDTSAREPIKLLAGVFRERGVIRRFDRAWQESLDDYGAAEEYLKTLLQTEPDDPKVLSDLAGLQRNIGNLWRDLATEAQRRGEQQDAEERWQQAATAMDQAVRIGREAYRVAEDDGRTGHELADHYNSLAVVQRNLGQHDVALQAYQEAIELGRELADRHPGNVEYMYGLSMRLNNVGNLYLKTDQLLPAREAFLEAIRLRETVVRLRPADPQYSHGLANSLLLASDVAQAQEDIDQARQWTDQATQVMRDSLKTVGEDIRLIKMLNTALHQLASIELLRDDGSAALEVYREAIEWQQKIITMPQNNDFDQANLATLHHEKAKVLAELGHTEQALMHYATAAQRWEPLPMAAASFGAADSYCRSAKLAAAAGQLGEKQRYLDQAIAALRQLIEAGFQDAEALGAEPFDVLQDQAGYHELLEELGADQPP
ncbi:MAG: serine/threonine protein kinase [Planctomycetaceae bacterium]|nr:MAG: serine/threonine protein kinase [Planctomycetaceae bacterium]